MTNFNNNFSEMVAPKTSLNIEKNYEIDGIYSFVSSTDPNNIRTYKVENNKLFLKIKVKNDKTINSKTEEKDISKTDYIEKWLLLCSPAIFVLYHVWDRNVHDSHIHLIGYFDRDKDWVDNVQIKDTEVLPTVTNTNKTISLLKDKGIVISPINQGIVGPALYDYILNQDNVPDGYVVKKIGWADKNHKVYVLTYNVIQGADDKKKYIVTNTDNNNGFCQKGTLEGWKKQLASLAIGNFLLVLAVSTAFVGPLLRLLNFPIGDDGGIHLYGLHGKGKSSALEITATVWGYSDNGGFMGTWDKTTNNFEAAGESRNDNLLILDEAGRLTQKKNINQVVYCLQSGTGKGRLDSNANQKRLRTFRVFILSSGEKTISQIATEGGVDIEGGVEDRLPSIHADGGTKNGIFTDLKGFKSSAELALAIKYRTSINCPDDEANFGVAGPEFVSHLINADIEKLRNRWQEFQKSFIERNKAEQVSRVASRFALIAFAGELATEFSITGWPEGEALKAAEYGLKMWLKEHHGANHERYAALSKIADDINANRTSKYLPVNTLGKYCDSSIKACREINGFIKVIQKEIVIINCTDNAIIKLQKVLFESEEIWLTPQSLKRITGLNTKDTVEILSETGWLITDKENKTVYRYRIIGSSQTAVIKLNNAFSSFDVENNCLGIASFVCDPSKQDTFDSDLTLEISKEVLDNLPKLIFNHLTGSLVFDNKAHYSEKEEEYPVFAFKISEGNKSLQINPDELDKILKKRFKQKPIPIYDRCSTIELDNCIDDDVDDDVVPF